MPLRSHRTGQPVELSGAEVIGTGGQATIYALSPELAAKLYHRPTERHGAKLVALLWRDGSAPDEIPAGFLMPRILGARPVFEFYNPRSRRQHSPYFHYGYL